MNDVLDSIVLCEGYHDRAFLQGALLKIGCTDPGEQPDGSRKPIQDPDGRTVRGGQFAFLSKSQNFVRVHPCGGKSKIPAELKRLLKDWPTRKYARIVVFLDSDGDARASIAAPPSPSWVEDAVKQADTTATRTPKGDFATFGGGVIVSAATWWTNDEHTSELPWKQTLERLIVASLRDAYHDRGAAVATWLTGLPGGGKDGHKEHAWSHMAGWYADRGCEGFCRFVWQDPKVATGLQHRLRSCGCWRILDELAT
jgi:hypothetical protein